MARGGGGRRGGHASRGRGGRTGGRTEPYVEEEVPVRTRAQHREQEEEYAEFFYEDDEPMEAVAEEVEESGEEVPQPPAQFPEQIPVHEPPQEPAQVPGEAGPTGDTETRNMLRSIEAAFHRMSRGTGGSRETPAAAAQRQFRMMEPPKFEGTGEPIEADRWLTAMEKIFKSIQLVEDELKMMTAPNYLQGEAGDWWKSQEDVYGQDGITWAEFRQLFLDEFFPDILREAKRTEFSNLVQKNMTVQQYQRAFTSLSKYAPELVATERMRCRKFERGLKPSIHIPVAAGLHKTYKDVVEAAMKAEIGIAARQQLESSRPPKPPGRSSGSTFRGSGPRRDQRGGGSGPSMTIESGGDGSRKRSRDAFSSSTFRGRFDTTRSTASGSAPRGPPECYTCGQPGHYSRDCPSAYPSGRACYVCGGRDHLQSTCPQIVCRGCGKKGHYQSQCPENIGAPGDTQRQDSSAPPEAAPKTLSITGSSYYPRRDASSGAQQGTRSARGGFSGNRGRGGHQQGQTSQAHAYAFPPPTFEVGEPSGELGTLLCLSTWASVLFDTGTSRSLVVLSFTRMTRDYQLHV